MRTLAIILAVMGNALADDETPLELALLKEKRDTAVQGIDRTFKVELEKLRFAYTKRGDLDSANKVNAMVEAVAVSPRLGEDFAAVAGEWHVVYANKATRVYKIDLAGNVTDDHGRKAKLDPLKQGYILDYGEKSYERLTIRAERLFIEHWNPKGSFGPELVPQQFGIGTRAVKP